MPTFIGLDLAWTATNESGVCWLQGTAPADLRCTRVGAAAYGVAELADGIAAVEGPVVVAIDAPVLYAPERRVEREIARRFGRYKASAHSAHHAVAQGRTAGIDLGAALGERGFTLDPAALLGEARAERIAVEVYPHTIHVLLFGLRERLPYKPKQGRDVAFRRNAMREYQGHLRALMEREAAGALASADVLRALDPQTATMAKGRALKRLDDTLDGLTCALAAWLAWRHPGAWEAIGDEHGTIVAPRERPALP